MYHLANDGVEEAIKQFPISPCRGLGLAAGITTSNSTLRWTAPANARDLKAWFDELLERPGACRGREAGSPALS